MTRKRHSEASLDEDGTPLTKVLVEYLDEDGLECTERLWAKPLGNDLFELRNAPWVVYKLNWGDVVLTVEAAPDAVPRVLKVVERSGHRTLRIMFRDRLSAPAAQREIIEELKQRSALVERESERFVAVDVEPQADYEAVFQYLHRLEKTGQGLTFEEAWVDDGRPGFNSPDAPSPDP